LLQRVFRVDVLVCDRCGRVRRILAAILDRDAIRKILAQLGLPTELPTFLRARPPPGAGLEPFA